MASNEPGLFGSSIDELLSPDWETMGLQAAMETIWTVLQSARLVNVPAPLGITGVGGETPAMSVQNFGDSPIAFEMNRRPQLGFNPVKVPWEQLPQQPSDGQKATQPTQTVFLGKIASGSGNNYQVSLYGNGPAATPTKSVGVTQVQAGQAATIPAGTWTLVLQIGKSYFMSVPQPTVFLGKVTSGSGTSYQVALNGEDPNTPSTQTVTVTQLQIASGATIPANTWVWVLQVNGSYYMQSPVWL